MHIKVGGIAICDCSKHEPVKKSIARPSVPGRQRPQSTGTPVYDVPALHTRPSRLRGGVPCLLILVRAFVYMLQGNRIFHC